MNAEERIEETERLKKIADSMIPLGEVVMYQRVLSSMGLFKDIMLNRRRLVNSNILIGSVEQKELKDYYLYDLELIQYNDMWKYKIGPNVTRGQFSTDIRDWEKVIITRRPKQRFFDMFKDIRNEAEFNVVLLAEAIRLALTSHVLKLETASEAIQSGHGKLLTLPQFGERAFDVIADKLPTYLHDAWQARVKDIRVTQKSGKKTRLAMGNEPLKYYRQGKVPIFVAEKALIEKLEDWAVLGYDRLDVVIQTYADKMPSFDVVDKVASFQANMPEDLILADVRYPKVEELRNTDVLVKVVPEIMIPYLRVATDALTTIVNIPELKSSKNQAKSVAAIELAANDSRDTFSVNVYANMSGKVSVDTMVDLFVKLIKCTVCTNSYEIDPSITTQKIVLQLILMRIILRLIPSSFASEDISMLVKRRILKLLIDYSIVPGVYDTMTDPNQLMIDISRQLQGKPEVTAIFNDLFGMAMGPQNAANWWYLFGDRSEPKENCRSTPFFLGGRTVVSAAPIVISDTSIRDDILYTLSIWKNYLHKVTSTNNSLVVMEKYRALKMITQLNGAAAAIAIIPFLVAQQCRSIANNTPYVPQTFVSNEFRTRLTLQPSAILSLVLMEKSVTTSYIPCDVINDNAMDSIAVAGYIYEMVSEKTKDLFKEVAADYTRGYILKKTVEIMDVLGYDTTLAEKIFSEVYYANRVTPILKQLQLPLFITAVLNKKRIGEISDMVKMICNEAGYSKNQGFLIVACAENFRAGDYGYRTSYSLDQVSILKTYTNYNDLFADADTYMDNNVETPLNTKRRVFEYITHLLMVKTETSYEMTTTPGYKVPAIYIKDCPVLINTVMHKKQTIATRGDELTIRRFVDDSRTTYAAEKRLGPDEVDSMDNDLVLSKFIQLWEKKSPIKLNEDVVIVDSLDYELTEIFLTTPYQRRLVAVPITDNSRLCRITPETLNGLYKNIVFRDHKLEFKQDVKFVINTFETNVDRIVTDIIPQD